MGTREDMMNDLTGTDPADNTLEAPNPAPETPEPVEPVERTEPTEPTDKAIEPPADPRAGTKALLDSLSEPDPNAGQRGPDGKFLPKEAQKPAGDPKMAVQPEAKTDSPKTPEQEAEDLIKEMGVKSERGQERIKQVFAKAKDAESKATQLEADINEFREMVVSTGMTPQEFGETLEFGRLLKTGDEKSLRTALEMVDQQRQMICKQLGIEAPGVDPLADFPDLKTDIESMAMTKERALEVAKYRRQDQARQQAQQVQDQSQQDIQTFQQSLAQAGQAAEVYFETRKAEADYPAKMQRMHAYFKDPAKVQEFVSTYEPKQWFAQFKFMYDNMSVPAAPRVPQAQPARSSQMPDQRRAREIIAVMAERNIQNSITKRVLDAIRKFLNSIGFTRTDITDAEIAGLLRDAQAYLREQGREMVAGEAAAFSRSAMKSVEANIDRGEKALSKALLDKSTVHRAMYRNEIGWVDFVWGDTKKGIAHIIAQRIAKDGMSEAQAVRFLKEGLIDVIARGEVTRRSEARGGVRLLIQRGQNAASLVRAPGSNAFVLTGFEIRPSGEQGVGFDTSKPTQTAPMLTRRGLGADGKTNLPQDDNLRNDASFSRGEQGNLDVDVDERQRDPIRARDLFASNRDMTGRRRNLLGEKLYDRMTEAINPMLAKVKLSNDAPDAFKQMMRQFSVDQNKALENAKRVAEVGTQTLTPEERILISDIIEKNVATGDLPPENVAKIAADIGAALKHQAQELVDLGMASPERLLENYLPRAYRNPLLARLTNKEMFVSWYQKAKLRMNGNRLKSRGLVDTVDLKDLEKYQKLGWTLSSMSDGTPIPDDLWDAIQTGSKVPPQYAQELEFLMWRDFTEEERAKMGEIRDGILRYAMGYTETQRDIAIGRLFKAIAENNELSSAVNPGGWTRVPDQAIPGTELKRYGALSGLFVPPYIRDVIERSTQPKGPLMQMYDKALSFWKEGKTVWNPVSHGNNIVSNVFVMHFAGLNPADPRPWRGTVREYRTKGQYYVEAIDNGLFGTEFASKDIQELFLPDLTDELDVETVVASRFNKVVEALKKAGKPVSWYRDKMQKAYEFEDQFFKLMIFTDRRKNGASIEDAIADTERYIFNYSDIPEGVEVAKRIYSPFISYTYKALPMLVHTAMTRPDRLLLPIALLGGANWLAYAITGGDEEDERKGMPEYMQGRSSIGTPKAVRMPFNVDDRPAFMDISRRVPMGDLFDLTNQTGGLAVPAPMMPSHPLFTATAAMLFNIDTFTGKEVTQKSDTNWESAQKRAGWAWKQMVPNAPFVPGSWNWDKLMNGAANAFDTEMMGYTGYTKAGDPIKLPIAVLDVSTGTKIRSYDPERGIDFKEYQIDKERKEVQANIRSAMRNKSMTPDARREYVDKQQVKMKELQKKRVELK